MLNECSVNCDSRIQSRASNMRHQSVIALLFWLLFLQSLSASYVEKVKKAALKKPWNKLAPGTTPPFRDSVVPQDKNIQAEQYRHWPNHELPYEITGSSFTAEDTDNILASMAHIEARSCITFREKTDSDTNWVDINHNSTGCFATLGYYDHIQIAHLNLELPGCAVTFS